MIELTEAQQHAVKTSQAPLCFRDPKTNETYVLLKQDTYERMRRIVDGFARSAGWDDPELDVYEQYRKKA